MKYFTHEQLMPDCYAITDIAGTHSFLVTGTQRAALIDTGIGLGSLKSYVRNLTQLPLTVIGTHGHHDHMGGSGEFEEVYLSPRDFCLAGKQTVEERMEYSKTLYLAMNPGADWKIDRSDYLPVRQSAYTELEDQQRFCLGGLTLRILGLPGHTQGSVAVLIEEKRVVIFGDACNPGVFLFGEGASCVEQYMAQLKKFKMDYENLYDRVLVSHGEAFIDKSILDRCICVCGEILAGTDDHIAVTIHGQQAYSAKKTGPFGKRLDGGLGNIIYSAVK